MKCQILFSGKNKKISSAELAESGKGYGDQIHLVDFASVYTIFVASLLLSCALIPF